VWNFTPRSKRLWENHNENILRLHTLLFRFLPLHLVKWWLASWKSTIKNVRDISAISPAPISEQL
jgi:hypothetical protein